MPMDEMNRENEGKIRVVCFTGHRVIDERDAERIPRLLEEVISDFCERGAMVFRAGGAMGFDTLAALKVLDMKTRYPNIRLELILPCRNQTERWDDASRKTYVYILQNADSHRFLFDTYFEGCMQERDRRLVDGSDACIAYCVHGQGGTAYTFAHAIRAGIETVNLHELLDA